MNVLQNYENKSERLSTTQVSEGEEDYFDRMDKNEDLSIEIDEVALIKEIVKTKFIKNTKTELATSSQAKCIKFGKKKFYCWMTMETN